MLWDERTDGLRLVSHIYIHAHLIVWISLSKSMEISRMWVGGIRQNWEYWFELCTYGQRARGQTITSVTAAET